MGDKTDRRRQGSGRSTGFLTRRWREFLIALLVLSFLPIPVWLLVDNYTYSGGVERLPYSAYLGPPKYNYFGSPVEVYSPGETGKPNDLCVTFEFLSLDEATSQASFGILIDATPAGEQDLMRQLKSLKPAPTVGMLQLTSTSGVNSLSVPFPVSSLEKVPLRSLETAKFSCNSSSTVKISQLDSYAGFRTTQSIFTLGTPRAFPDDWYELDDAVTVSIQGVTLYSSLIMTSRDENYTLSASVYQRGKHANAGPNILEFTIRRPWLLVVYTYLVAAMPFVLLIAVFIIKYCRKRSEHDVSHPDGEMPRPFEAAFGIGATLVAILPLRSVLVPSSLPSPTRLDFYFGLGAVFLVAAAIFWVIGTSPGLQQPPETAADDPSHAGLDGTKVTEPAGGPAGPALRPDAMPTTCGRQSHSPRYPRPGVRSTLIARNGRTPPGPRSSGAE